MYSANKLDSYYQYLITSFFFFLSVSVFLSKLISLLIILLWIVSGDYKLKISSVLSNSLSVVSITFFIWLAVSLLWTENLIWGGRMLTKMFEFAILIPILLSISRYENFRIYLFAFLIGILLTSALILLDYFGYKFYLGFGKVSSKTPFVSSISQGILFTFAIFISLNEIWKNINSNSSRKPLTFMWFFILFILIFIQFDSNSRAGQVGTIVALFIFFSRNFKFRDSLILFFTLTIFIFGISYSYSDNFKDRVDRVFIETSEHLQGNYEATSIGLRLYWYKKTLEIIEDNFWLGVGMGDYKESLTEKMKEDDTSIKPHVNPHNMYLLIFSTTGIFGLIFFLNIFVLLTLRSLKDKDKIKSDYGLFLSVLFLIVMMTDSYLLGHVTQQLFVVILAGIFSKPYISKNEDSSNYSKI